MEVLNYLNLTIGILDTIITPQKKTKIKFLIHFLRDYESLECQRVKDNLRKRS